MKSNLIEAMESIKSLTEELIKIVEGDDYSNLENTLCERQQKIDSLQELGCSMEEYRDAEESFELNNLQQVLFKLMENKKIEIREKLNDLFKNKVVTNSYNHNNLVGSKIFSKKI
ncbi:MAG: hypothetical protein K0R54_3304 [Clostridiaceae bacterium]|nr:hypothetical protein [Clostridiaceae bacterium]